MSGRRTLPPRRISVIIGTHNRPDLLAEALASIRALESRDLTFEILVGDNGSTPETKAVVERFGGIYAQTAIPGCPAARNLAMARATGEFIAFLDDDDMWTPRHIRPHIAMLDAHPEYAAVFSQIQYVDDKLNSVREPWPVQWSEQEDVFLRMMSGYFPQVGATVARASVLKQYGLMDETLLGDSDWDWQLRIARDHRIGFVPVPSVKCRVRPAGSFDKLQRRRIGYTRRIFWRHAWPNRQRWPSLTALARSYFGSVSEFSYYFHDAAARRARSGDVWGAVKAGAYAFTIVPTRAFKAYFRPFWLLRAAAAAIAAYVGTSVLQPPHDGDHPL